MVALELRFFRLVLGENVVDHFHVHPKALLVKRLKLANLANERIAVFRRQMRLFMPAQILPVVARVRALITPENVAFNIHFSM